jgi:hypothetical protein
MENAVAVGDGEQLTQRRAHFHNFALVNSSDRHQLCSVYTIVTLSLSLDINAGCIWYQV